VYARRRGKNERKGLGADVPAAVGGLKDYRLNVGFDL
jgi:hypothetical protein